MKDWPTVAEMRIMKMLQDRRKGLYGLQIVEESGNAIKRGSVYVLLGRLEEKGFVKAEKPQIEPGYPGLPRPIYKLTGEGAQVLRAANSLGMTLVGASS